MIRARDRSPDPASGAIERLAVVCGIDASRIELEPYGACTGCACSGRCAFGGGAVRLALPPQAFPAPPTLGDTVRLAVEPAALRRLAFALHGRLLAGLLLGAAAGAGVASLAADPIEWFVAAGAALGMLIALQQSRQALLALVPRIEILSQPDDEIP